MTGVTFRKLSRTWRAWIGKWQGKYSKLVDWVEGNIIETRPSIDYRGRTTSI